MNHSGENLVHIITSIFCLIFVFEPFAPNSSASKQKQSCRNYRLDYLSPHITCFMYLRQGGVLYMNGGRAHPLPSCGERHRAAPSPDSLCGDMGALCGNLGAATMSVSTGQESWVRGEKQPSKDTTGVGLCLSLFIWRALAGEAASCPVNSAHCFSWWFNDRAESWRREGCPVPAFHLYSWGEGKYKVLFLIFRDIACTWRYLKSSRFYVNTLSRC